MCAPSQREGGGRDHQKSAVFQYRDGFVRVIENKELQKSEQKAENAGAEINHAETVVMQFGQSIFDINPILFL